MSDSEQPISAEAAEKAYEAAAANAVALADASAPAIAHAVAQVPAASEPLQSPLEFPAKAERAAAPAEAAKAKPAAAKKVSKQAKSAKPTAPAAKPSAEVTFTTKPVQFIKESIMPAKKTTADFIKTVKTAAADVQAKAKVAAADVQAKAKLAYAKGAEVAGEAVEFTKGNVDAVVTSGKILGTGLQELGKTYAAEGKVTFETVTSDVKKISEVKTPVEFLQTQSAILRRNFDHAVEFNTKTGETLINLFGSAFAPLSARASLVVEKVKKAA